MLEKPVEPTAVDDVRRVREKIARLHQGDLRGHLAESARIANQFKEKLRLRSPSQQQRNANS